MRILMKIGLPHAAYNAAVRDGSAGAKTRAILEAVQPEAVYFTEFNGQRTVIMIVELEAPSRVPALDFNRYNANTTHGASSQVP